MAGAYLTIGAKYRPFSYEELIRPVAMATEMHNKIDEQYAALQEKAGVWENLANKETDPESYKKYKEYSDALNAQAEELAKNGLNPQSMRDMLNLRARYSSDIVPLEQAYTRRRQLADEQRKMIMQNPTLKFERDMNTTSLDDFVNNPELDYGYSVNGAMIAKQAGEAYSHLAKSIQEEPQYKHILNGNYYQSMLRSGYSPEQILALARNDESAPAALRQISQQIYDSTGVEDFIKRAYPNASTSEGEALQAQEWRDYVNSYINQGAWSAVGTTSYGTVVDQDAALRRSLAIQAAKAKQKGTSGNSSAIQRRDQTITMKSTSGKRGYMQKPMGNIEVDDAYSKNIINRILASEGVFARKGGVEEVVGMEDNGKLTTRTIKNKDFIKNLDKATVTNIRVDYQTGSILADIIVVDGKNSEKLRIKLPNEILGDDISTQDVQISKAALDAVEEAKKTGKKVSFTANGVPVTIAYKDGKVIEYDQYGNILEQASEEAFKGFWKDAMFAAIGGIMQYTGGLNTNTDTGAKRAAATSTSNMGRIDVEDLE